MKYYLFLLYVYTHFCDFYFNIISLSVYRHAQVCRIHHQCDGHCRQRSNPYLRGRRSRQLQGEKHLGSLKLMRIFNPPQNKQTGQLS